MPVKSWFDDPTDSELLDLIPLFEKLSKVDSVYTVLCNSNNPLNQSLYNSAPLQQISNSVGQPSQQSLSNSSSNNINSNDLASNT